MTRLYANTLELAEDLDNDKHIADPRVLNHIRAASAWIDKQIGWFVPVTMTKRFDGKGGVRLPTDPLIAVTSIVDGSLTLDSSGYLLYPRNRYFDAQFGCYTGVELDPDSSYGEWQCKRDNVAVLGQWGKWAETVATGATLGAALDASQTTLTASNGTVIAPGMVLLVESEQILVIGINDLAGKVFVVQRGVNGTTAATHSDSLSISRYVVPADVNWLCKQMAGLMLKKTQSQYAGKVGNDALGEVFYTNEFPTEPIKQIKKAYRIVVL